MTTTTIATIPPLAIELIGASLDVVMQDLANQLITNGISQLLTSGC